MLLNTMPLGRDQRFNHNMGCIEILITVAARRTVAPFNHNMGCIEIHARYRLVSELIRFNHNMGCIEMSDVTATVNPVPQL